MDTHGQDGQVDIHKISVIFIKTIFHHDIIVRCVRCPFNFMLIKIESQKHALVVVLPPSKNGTSHDAFRRGRVSEAHGCTLNSEHEVNC